MENKSILNCPVKFDKSSFFDLLSLSAGASIAFQNAMGEHIIGDNGWNLDIRSGTITFGASDFPAGILGFESRREATWLWGWAHTESGLPEKICAPSRRAKRVLSDVPEFTAPKFMLDDIHSGHNIAMICCGVSERNVCYYRCPHDDGAIFVQVEGLPNEVFAPIELPAFMRQYMEIVSGLYVDHRLLAAGFLYRNGNAFTDNGNEITAQFGSYRLHLMFEEVDGISRIVNSQAFYTEE